MRERRSVATCPRLRWRVGAVFHQVLLRSRLAGACTAGLECRLGLFSAFATPAVRAFEETAELGARQWCAAVVTLKPDGAGALA